MQVRVNPNWSFKRVTRAWLRTGFAWLIWINLAAIRPFKRAKILNAEKKGGMNKPPQSSPHMNIHLFSLKFMTKQEERYYLTNIFQMV